MKQHDYLRGVATQVGRIEQITPLGDVLPVPLGNTEHMNTDAKESAK